MLRELIGLAVLTAAGAAVAAGPYSLTSDGYNYGWSNAYYWQDAGGNRSGADGDPLDPTVDYTMAEDLKTPQADGGDYAFGGKSLTMTEMSRLFVYTYNKARILFPRDGLVIQSGGASKFNATADAAYTLVGDITVDVKDHVFRSEYDNPTFVFEGAFHGTGGKRLRIANKATKVVLSSDLSDFAGTIALWVAGSRLEVARNTTSGEFYFYGAGTLAVSNQVTVGSLTMPANSTLEFGGWYRQDACGLVTAGETGRIVVTGTPTLTAPINVLVKDSARVPNTSRIPVLTVPSAYDLKEDDFVLSAAAFDDAQLTVETDSASGTKTLYLTYAPTGEPITVTDQVSVGTLSLLPDAQLVFGGKGVKTDAVLTGWVAGCLTVTDALVLGGKVNLIVRDDALVPVFAGETPETMSIALLTVPAATALDLDAFDLSAEAFADAELSIVPDVQAGTKSICLSYAPTVVMTVSDMNSANFNLNYGSSLTNAAYWSDGQVPHAGAHYLVRTAEVTSPGLDYVGEHTVFLRTPGGATKGESSTIGFAGESLCVSKGCCLVAMASRWQFANGKKLRLLDGSAVCNGQALELNIDGPVEMPSGEVSVGAWCDATLNFNGSLGGAAKIRCRGAIFNTSVAGGTTAFNGDLSDFAGTLEAEQSFASKYGYPTVKFATAGYASTTLDAFDAASVTLKKLAKLVVDDDVMLAKGSNRGLSVGDTTCITNQVASGKRLTIGTQLTMADDGKMAKTGAGTLELGGDVRFGAAGTEDPAAGKTYSLTVAAGTLAVSGAKAIDGLSVTLADGAALVLKYDPDDAALVASGIRNAKSATPFALSGTRTTLPLAVEFPSGLAKTSHRVALVTVSKDAAADMRTMLSGVSVSCRGFVYTPWEETEDETVTFGGTLEPSGLMLIFR